MTQDQRLYHLLGTRMLDVPATLKRDGRPQLSNVIHHYDAAARIIRVSLTDDRARTKNLRRGPRASEPPWFCWRLGLWISTRA